MPGGWGTEAQTAADWPQPSGGGGVQKHPEIEPRLEPRGPKNKGKMQASKGGGAKRHSTQSPTNQASDQNQTCTVLTNVRANKTHTRPPPKGCPPRPPTEAHVTSEAPTPTIHQPSAGRGAGPRPAGLLGGGPSGPAALIGVVVAGLGTGER